MPKHQMLINVVAGEECRIAIVADGRLEELYQERASSESHVGNIYKGRVTNVEPSIQAAFVDFGQERNGFLHISDLHPMYFAGHDKDETEMVGQKTPRRDRPPIQKCLRRGQEILVQVLKEGIGTKGPTLTSYLSIPGRYLVMMPSMERLGVSRKVEDDDARREMRRILDELNPPQGFGFIIRTAGIGKNKTELKRDLAYLQRLWSSIEQRKKHVNVGELFAESDLVVRTIRDIFSTDIEQIIVDDELAAKRARDFLAIANPRTSSKVALYNDPIPLFHRFDIERQIETISARTVPLPSGGSLVIDSTEALVAIDVNSGKMRDARDAEGTAFKANMEAADEICRQLRLRDLGGVIVSDLIDMRDLRHRRQVETRFRDNLKRDRARTRTSPISQFGILEMTRQRMRPSLRKSIYIDCPHCEGAAQVKSPESVVLDVMRRLALVMHRDNVARVELTVAPAVAFALLNKKRSQLVGLESMHNKSIMVRVNESGSADFVSLLAFDERGGQVEGESLSNMGTFELVPVEAVKGKAVINRPEAEPVEIEADEEDSQEESEQSAMGEFDQDEQDDQDESQQRDASNDENDHAESDGVAEHRDEAQGEDGEPKKRRRRRRRGGRGRSKRTGDQASEEGGDSQSESADEHEQSSQRDLDSRDLDSRDSDERGQNQDNVERREAENQSKNFGRDIYRLNPEAEDTHRNEANAPSDESQSQDSEKDQPAKPSTGGAQLAGLSKLASNQHLLKRDVTVKQVNNPANDVASTPVSNDDENDPDGDRENTADNNSNNEVQSNASEGQEDGQSDGEEEGGVKKRRRRRRGGRRRSGANAAAGQDSNTANAEDNGGNNGNSGNSDTSIPQDRVDTGTRAQKDGNRLTPMRNEPTSRGNSGNNASNDVGQDTHVVSRGYHNPVLKQSTTKADTTSDSTDKA